MLKSINSTTESKIFKELEVELLLAVKKLRPTEIGFLDNGIEFRVEGSYYHLKVIHLKPRKKNGTRKSTGPIKTSKS